MDEYRIWLALSRLMFEMNMFLLREALGLDNSWMKPPMFLEQHKSSL